MFLRKSSGVDLGKVRGSLGKREILTDEELNHHVQIVGATGFGKTNLISHIVRDQIFRNRGLLFVDLKNDIETIEKFKAFSKDSRREEQLKLFSLSDSEASAHYNPAGRGSATQLKDRLMASLNWSEEYYKNQTSSFLIKLLKGLCHLRDVKQKTFDLHTIYRASHDFEFLQSLCLEISEAFMREKELLESCLQFLRVPEQFKCLQGLRSQLESLLLSDFGELLRQPTDTNKSVIDLFQSVTHREVVFFFLDSRRYGESARVIAKLLVEDLKAVSAKVDSEIPKAFRQRFTCIFDEFADFAQTSFIGFLDRARSASFAIVVSHQEIADLKSVSPEFPQRLMGNTATLYAFLQKGSESAELISSTAGTRSVWKETERSSKLAFFDMRTGEKSLREVEEFIIHPNSIKSLRVGECAVIKKYPRSRAYFMKTKFGP